MTHETTKIAINDKIVEIDNRLVDVVRELNNVGLKTRYCCEGNSDITDEKRDGRNVVNVRNKAYISIEASPGVIFEFKENRLIIRWVLI